MYAFEILKIGLFLVDIPHWINFRIDFAKFLVILPWGKPWPSPAGGPWEDVGLSLGCFGWSLAGNLSGRFWLRLLADSSGNLGRSLGEAWGKPGGSWAEPQREVGRGNNPYRHPLFRGRQFESCCPRAEYPYRHPSLGRGCQIQPSASWIPLQTHPLSHQGFESCYWQFLVKAKTLGWG